MKKIVEVEFNKFLPKVKVEIDIPNDREAKEYIDNYFNNIHKDIRWKFV